MGFRTPAPYMGNIKQKERDEKILKLLDEYSEGLSIEEISTKIEVSKITIARDLERLVWKQMIIRRNLGTTRLHYLKKHTKKFKGNYENKN